MSTQGFTDVAESGQQVSERNGEPVSNMVTDAILRGTGVVLLMGLAIIHVVQIVPTIEQTPILGVAYLLLIAASIVVAARLVVGGPSAAQMWLPVAGLGAAVIVGYAFTRMLSTPLDNQDVGNWSCMLGLAALFVEGLLVVMSGYAMSIRKATVRTALVATQVHHYVMPIRESSDEELESLLS